MKSVTLITLVLSTLISMAQNYQISFTASGAANYVNSVYVYNLSKGTKLVIGGNEILQLVWNVGIEDKQNNIGLKVIPNPFSGSTNIIISSAISRSTDVQVFDFSGKVVISSKIWLNQGENSILVSGLSSGFYLFSLRSDNLAISTKLISTNSEEGSQEIHSASVYNKSGLKTKEAKNLVQMHYNSGERILFQGVSGQYSRITTLIPSHDQIVDFEFIDCKDGDSIQYAVVAIFNMTWMAENLRTTKYRDGTPIPLKAVNWNNDTTPAYCWFNNDQAAYGNKYGALYNWYAVNTGNLCPAGWHVPSDAEWTNLAYSLLGESIAGGKLKETDTVNWQSPNTAATNETGFTALPGAYRDFDGTFYGLGSFGSWWSTTESAVNRAIVKDIYFNSGQLKSLTTSKGDGSAVRCVKDN